MIKKIIAWITGKTEPTTPAPYKVEAVPAGTEAQAAAVPAVWPFPTYKEITPEPKTEVVQVESVSAVVETVSTAVEPAAEVAVEEKPAKKARKIPAKVTETAPVEVSAKYAVADLKKMTKAELADLAAKHALEVKSRATKDELITVLSKV
jgi:hypothetical protein